MAVPNLAEDERIARLAAESNARKQARKQSRVTFETPKLAKPAQSKSLVPTGQDQVGVSGRNYYAQQYGMQEAPPPLKRTSAPSYEKAFPNPKPVDPMAAKMEQSARARTVPPAQPAQPVPAVPNGGIVRRALGAVGNVLTAGDIAQAAYDASGPNAQAMYDRMGMNPSKAPLGRFLFSSKQDAGKEQGQGGPAMPEVSATGNPRLAAAMNQSPMPANNNIPPLQQPATQTVALGEGDPSKSPTYYNRNSAAPAYLGRQAELGGYIEQWMKANPEYAAQMAPGQNKSGGLIKGESGKTLFYAPDGSTVMYDASGNVTKQTPRKFTPQEWKAKDDESKKYDEELQMVGGMNHRGELAQYRTKSKMEQNTAAIEAANEEKASQRKIAEAKAQAEIDARKPENKKIIKLANPDMSETAYAVGERSGKASKIQVDGNDQPSLANQKLGLDQEKTGPVPYKEFVAQLSRNKITLDEGQMQSAYQRYLARNGW